MVSRIFNKQIKSSLGFSLIELLVAIAIMVSLTMTGAFVFLQLNKSKNLNVAYGDFVNTIYEAKTDSLSQVKTSLCTPAQTLIGYQITIDKSSMPNFYTLGIVCFDPPVSDIFIQIKKVNLPSDVTIDLFKTSSPVRPAGSFLFLIPSGIIDASYSATLTSQGQNKSVGIDENGVILPE